MTLRMTVPETDAYRWRHAEYACPTGYAGLYRMYNAFDELLYVGISSTLVERWRRHKQRATWWPEVSYITYEFIYQEHRALEAERLAIRSEMPAYNIRSAVRAA